MAIASFHNLHVLQLSFFEASFTGLRTCLSPFPAIRDLALEVRGKCFADALPATALAPHLHRYTGPCVLVHLVLRHNSLQKITITTGGGFAPDLLHALQGSGAGDAPYESMRSLTVAVEYADLSGSMLLDIFALFPRLASLTLHLYSEDPPSRPAPSSPAERAREVFGRLRTSLSLQLGLESVVLNWWVRGIRNAALPDVAELKAALLSSVPSLKHVSFGGHWNIRWD